MSGSRSRCRGSHALLLCRALLVGPWLRCSVSGAPCSPARFLHFLVTCLYVSRAERCVVSVANPVGGMTRL